MAKYCGKVGYGISTETSPGIWEPVIVVHEYFGDIVRNNRKMVTATGTLNDDVKMSNEISIVADPFANENFQSIMYIEYMGSKWEVDAVEVQRPRLILSMGVVYNG